MAETPNLERKMQRTAFACVGIVVGMVGLAYASVPLYDLFCKVTGFGGTPIVRDENGSEVMDRIISVRFDSNVAPGLNWRFSPEKPEVKVKLGETTTVYYKVTNAGDRPSTGIATYNVQPDLAGTYFSKLECFCFTEQTLQPGETLESAVVFYVDPRLVQDPDVKDLTSITLSYTYFPSKGGKPVAEATSSTKPIAQ
ncbi:cytochrome c oxidase assembly protein [Microvirga zambiensis]|uniref:cytochrome c oxidase assembly protein n=1 Tax=Microvirga zambiensis TaxID=1402137 RepID=UPI00191FDC64|nr:cytochrome c oxidase assembly protein [Microvirga zambiensis]